MELDIAMGLLRLTLGLTLLAHGCNKVFGAGGMAGTERWFDALGLRPAWLHARMAAGVETVVALMLLVGLGTTIAVAGCVGLMVVAARTDHRDKGFFVFRGGWEYVAVFGLAALPLALVGPGRASVDHVLDLTLAGWQWGLAAAAVGAAGGTALLVACYRPTTS